MMESVPHTTKHCNAPHHGKIRHQGAQDYRMSRFFASIATTRVLFNITRTVKKDELRDWRLMIL
jgi:hypothetical protein